LTVPPRPVEQRPGLRSLNCRTRLLAEAGGERGRNRSTCTVWTVSTTEMLVLERECFCPELDYRCRKVRDLEVGTEDVDLPQEDH
jgi:hypothetical protein